MAAGHSWSVVLHFLIHFFIFLPLLHLFEFARHLSSLFNNDNNYDNNNIVDVRRVIWRHVLRTNIGDAFDCVLHLHARFEDARRFAWDDPDVHLYHLSEEGAVFVRTKKGVDVYSSNVGAFCFHPITAYAIEFGLVPLSVFRRIATDELNKLNACEDKAKKKVVFIAGIPRSGTTATLQRFEHIPGCQTISEHPAFLNIAAMTVGDAFRAHLFQPALLFVVKALWRRPGVDVVALKFPGVTPWLLADAMDGEGAWPFDARFLFPYRGPEGMMNSWLKLITEINADAQAFANQLPFIGLFFPNSFHYRLDASMPDIVTSGLQRLIADDVAWRRRFYWTSELDWRPDKQLIRTTPEGLELPLGRTSLTGHFYTFYLTGILTLMELRRRKEFEGKFLAIRFEDFIADPEKWTVETLEFCGESEAAAMAAASTIQLDSQRSSPYSQKQISSHATKLSTEDVEKLEEVVKAAGFHEGLEAFRRVV